MRPFAIFALLLLTACAGPPGSDATIAMRWVEMDSVKDRCGADAVGCYRIIAGTCVVFTRKARGPYDEQLHTILGHETRHCFHGDFHPHAQYLDLKRVAK